jgi:hypothetical protein
MLPKSSLKYEICFKKFSERLTERLKDRVSEKTEELRDRKALKHRGSERLRDT